MRLIKTTRHSARIKDKNLQDVCVFIFIWESTKNMWNSEEAICVHVRGPFSLMRRNKPKNEYMYKLMQCNKLYLISLKFGRLQFHDIYADGIHRRKWCYTSDSSRTTTVSKVESNFIESKVTSLNCFYFSLDWLVHSSINCGSCD